MSHWGGLNLDWSDKGVGAERREGELDLKAAATWDRILALAEDKGVYVQLVLQHHGQYSTGANPNWTENPWNAANEGGFLVSPADFFTSPEAIKRTKQKYRYIIARWGYSPAVMAWELFNEVHWVDAMWSEAKDEAAVARWHSAMAAYLRSIDRYKHLITTSTEDLQSAIYADMDYFQPHHYSSNLLAGVRHLDAEPATLGRPIFYGEVGDDHLPIATTEKKAGVTIVPPIWASLMGEGRYAAQPWLGAKLMQTGRLLELGAVAKFVAATGMGRRVDLAPFSPVVESSTRIPFVLSGTHLWKRNPTQVITVPLDGREPLDFARIPRIFVSAEESKVNGFPSRVTYLFNSEKDTALRLQIGETSLAAGAMRVSIDGVAATEVSWLERAKDQPRELVCPVPEVRVVVPLGRHEVVVENSAPTGWFDLPKIEIERDVSVLAAVGQRKEGFMAIWLWHRANVFSSKAMVQATGSLVLDDVSAGTWRVTWWDTLKGIAAAPIVIQHRGGALQLPTPKISRHAAVVLERE